MLPACPWRDCDYVLFELWGRAERGSDADLPFAPIVEKMRECGLAGDADSWQRGKALLIALYQQLLGCRDLTEPDAERFFEIYKEALLKSRERAKTISLMASGAQADNLAARKFAAETARLNEKTREILAFSD